MKRRRRYSPSPITVLAGTLVVAARGALPGGQYHLLQSARVEEVDMFLASARKARIENDVLATVSFSMLNDSPRIFTRPGFPSIDIPPQDGNNRDEDAAKQLPFVRLLIRVNESSLGASQSQAPLSVLPPTCPATEEQNRRTRSDQNARKPDQETGTKSNHWTILLWSWLVAASTSS